ADRPSRQRADRHRPVPGLGPPPGAGGPPDRGLRPPPGIGFGHDHRTAPAPRRRRPADRKSTRLNSSHVSTSYAVFCLKKEKNLVEDELFYPYTRTQFSKANLISVDDSVKNSYRHS